jgi:CRP-like cAMP-binding protein
MFDTRAFVAGQTICPAGDKASEMFLIARGAAHVELAGGAVASELVRGDTFGEYGLFSAGIRTATVRAQEATAAYVLDYERFRRFLLAFPESLAALMARTVKQLQEQEAAMERSTRSTRPPQPNVNLRT